MHRCLTVIIRDSDEKFLMATCEACEVEMDVDEFDVDIGDELSCPECGKNLRVASLSPVELEELSQDNDVLDDIGEEFGSEEPEGEDQLDDDYN